MILANLISDGVEGDLLAAIQVDVFYARCVSGERMGDYEIQISCVVVYFLGMESADSQ